MTPEEAVIVRLASLSALTALVSTRIYQLRLPQTPTYPAVRVQRISEIRDPHLRGGGALRRTRIQIDTFDQEASGVDPLARAQSVAAAIEGDGGAGEASVSGLHGWRGTVSAAIEILSALKVSSGLEYDAAERRTVRVRDDYMVVWRPAA